jgi:hypothetical protein
MPTLTNVEKTSLSTPVTVPDPRLFGWSLAWFRRSFR